jgi:putative hemolysin
MNVKKLLVVFCLLLAACSPAQNDPTATTQPNMPNPASVYCEEKGYTLETITAADGSQSANCVFPDGSKCDEWAFYRGECKPGDAATTDSADIASDGCRIYRNEALGYSFHYPADAQIITNDDPFKSISVAGPKVNGEAWPQFSISHPEDREDYRPPEGANLAQWLTDHNLAADLRLQDVEIAGTSAVHVRFDGSPQSYAYDRYFFAKSDQLFMILIGHAGNKEDWDLYNHFLESIQFDE